MRKIKLVEGFGVNDVDYPVYKHEGNKIVWTCPYYKVWKSMIARCYRKQKLEQHETYRDCFICDEWKYLSVFREWVDKQPNDDWKNNQLDKDLLGDGKLYGPQTCAFVDSATNVFTITTKAKRGEYPLGVCYHKASGKFAAQCNDPYTRKRGHLGLFTCPLEAHKAWQKRKHQYACQLADQQSDPRVAEALRQRYAPDKDWSQR